MPKNNDDEPFGWNELAVALLMFVICCIVLVFTGRFYQ